MKRAMDWILLIQVIKKLKKTKMHVMKTHTKSIYIIGLRLDYNSETATEQRKRLNKIDLFRFKIIEEEYPQTSLLHGSNRKFCDHIRNVLKGELIQ